jgi:hypothetical protein
VENGHTRQVHKTVVDRHDENRSLASTAVKVDLTFDLRRKGLVWFSLYAVRFHGAWIYVHDRDVGGELSIELSLPDASAVYDDFRVVVDGVEYSGSLDAGSGVVTVNIPVHPGQSVAIESAYDSRGRDTWIYNPGSGLLEDLSLVMTTDYADIDFPANTMSPSSRARSGGGWALRWEFKRLVSGRSFGVATPTRIQPGELASRLSLAAPISLGFYFVFLFVLATMRGLDIHPMNYLFLDGAFLAFHLLFAYVADHVSVGVAFALSSVVSLALVTTYMRLVVSNRFALREAGLAQLVYLVGFAGAHFWEGFTGLAITVLSILTLFVLMQLTGRLRWSEVFDAPRRRAPGGGALQ